MSNRQIVQRSLKNSKNGVFSSQSALVEMREITKTFPGVKALTNVDLVLHRGEVLGLLGENGAGKSTLMNILGGIYRPDSGEIAIGGKPADIRGVVDAQEKGIAFVHQELALEPFLTVAENIFIGREIKNAAGFVSQSEMMKRSEQYLEMVGLHVSPDVLVNSLSMGKQQMVEIAKALALNSKVIVLDEPTSSLSEKEVDDLFEIVHKLKRKGLGVIYISHKMSEIFDLTDNVMVMRDGEYIGTVQTSTTDEDELVKMMVGRDVGNYYYRTYNVPGTVALSLTNYACKPWNKPISIGVRSGEILGVYGLIGAGRSELFESVMGFREPGTGDVEIFGEKIKEINPALLHDKGLALVPENRKTQGLFLFNDVLFNSSISSLKDFIGKLHVSSSKELAIAMNAVKTLNIKVPSVAQKVGNLSGGNQQKVVLGKWLATKPKILILDEPTRGIDVGAKSEIYKIINNLAKEGVAIIMISSELNEVMNMADRLVIMREGEITKIMMKDAFVQDDILKYALN